MKIRSHSTKLKRNRYRNKVVQKQLDILKCRTYFKTVTLERFQKFVIIFQKVGNLPFQEKVFEMFKVGKAGYITEVSTGLVLSVDSKSNEVTLKR